MTSMRTSMTRLAMRQARRHPRATLKTGMLAARHPRRTRRILQVAGLARRAPDIAHDRSARKHLRAAAASTTDARRRARRIGSPTAAVDAQFLHSVLDTARESAAVYRRVATKERRRRRMRRLAIGATALAAGTYVGRQRMSGSDSEAG